MFRWVEVELDFVTRRNGQGSWIEGEAMLANINGVNATSSRAGRSGGR